MREFYQSEVPAERQSCVVVQGDAFNGSRISTTVVCLIDSDLSCVGSPGNIALRKGDANLPKCSTECSATYSAGSSSC